RRRSGTEIAAVCCLTTERVRLHTGAHKWHWGPHMSNLTDVTRRLAAVFAADVEGYSRLMSTDEVGTLKGLTQRRAILDKLIGEHRGRIANTAGDSVLAEFGSAVDAVQCAVEAQTALAEANLNQAPESHQFPHRYPHRRCDDTRWIPVRGWGEHRCPVADARARGCGLCLWSDLGASTQN